MDRNEYNQHANAKISDTWETRMVQFFYDKRKHHPTVKFRRLTKFHEVKCCDREHDRKVRQLSLPVASDCRSSLEFC